MILTRSLFFGMVEAADYAQNHGNDQQKSSCLDRPLSEQANTDTSELETV